MFVPADLTVWGCSDGIRSVRELRVSFAPRLREPILGDEVDSAKISRPVLMLYDDKITTCAALLSDECQVLKWQPAPWRELNDSLDGPSVYLPESPDTAGKRAFPMAVASAMD